MDAPAGSTILTPTQPSPDSMQARSNPTAILFTATVFLGAFLLFVIEPMIAKMLLPKLGGSPAVWNTCMVFFQAALLAGYAYAHWISRTATLRAAAIIHPVVLCLPLVVLPIAVPRSWIPPLEANPVGWVLGLLALAVGLPFVVLSTGAPLFQKWYAATARGGSRDPYFLYSASNAGSFLALLAYPTLIEPMLRLDQQAKLWSVGYVSWIILAAGCALVAFRKGAATNNLREAIAQTDSSQVKWHPTRSQRLRWIALAAVPSSYLLGVTTTITTDIAPVPLLWIAPLAIYLLTFSIVFARKPLISHRRMVFALPLSMLCIVLFMLARPLNPALVVILIHLAGLFVAAMVCHGELARTRPSPQHLTQFYLLISLGGVIGGAFNALLAPLIFNRLWEYPIAVFLVCLLAPPRSEFRRKSKRLAVPKQLEGFLFTLILPVVVGVLAWQLLKFAPYVPDLGGTVIYLVFLAPAFLLSMALVERPLRFALAVGAMLIITAFPINEPVSVLLVKRSFFGVNQVQATAGRQFLQFLHGRTLHGSQHADGASLRPIDPEYPNTYYSHSGPIGQVMQRVPSDRLLNVAVVGLGAGSMAAYAHAGMTMTFYEIDPLVRDIAEDSGYFSYIPAARERGGDVKVVVGDARLTLASAPPESFDLLIIDAFSGDAIPIHLLTREAMQLYLSKLKPHGLLAMHITNRYLDLHPMVTAVADSVGATCIARADPMIDLETAQRGGAPSKWALIARDKEDLKPIDDGRWLPTPPVPSDQVWTDDYSNLLRVLNWRGEAR